MPSFAKRISIMEKSATVIRNLFSAMADPEIISFGGGAPAKEALPMNILREIASDVLASDKRGIEAFQYGPPIGMLELREIIVNDLLTPKGVDAKPENILIGNGGLEAINLVCQLYIEPGDVILVERPTFVQCAEIFEMFEARCVSCQMDDNGLVIEDVEEKIKLHNPKIVYTIPTFQNPTGKTLSLERRKALAELGTKYDVIILEDDPYRDIRYSGKDLAPIKAFDKSGNTVLANSFSKIFSPGSRLGYVVASDTIIKKLFDAKTATNSHSGMISQVLCAEFFKRGFFSAHHKMICDLYRVRRDVMMECIDKYFPEGTKRIYPDGGLFTWAELPGGLNATELLKEAITHKIAYVAGEGFFTDGNGLGSNCMRISFGSVEPERIRVGIERLGKLICSKL